MVVLMGVGVVLPVIVVLVVVPSPLLQPRRLAPVQPLLLSPKAAVVGGHGAQLHLPTAFDFAGLAVAALGPARHRARLRR